MGLLPKNRNSGRRITLARPSASLSKAISISANSSPKMRYVS
jgi:hypothetical protein